MLARCRHLVDEIVVSEHFPRLHEMTWERMTLRDCRHSPREASLTRLLSVTPFCYCTPPRVGS